MALRLFLRALFTVFGCSAGQRLAAASGSLAWHNPTFQNNARSDSKADELELVAEDTGLLCSRSQKKQMRVVVASVSWHAILAVIVLSAVALKYRAVEVETLPTDRAAPPVAAESSDDSGVSFAHVETKASIACNSRGSEDTSTCLSPRQLTVLKVFVFVFSFVTTLNCTVFIPASDNIAENAGGGIILSGLLLGAYGIGGVFGSFIIRSLTHKSIKAAFLFVCICMCVGNVTSLLSLLYPNKMRWDLLVFLSRMFAGMELGLDYTNQVLIMEILTVTNENNVRVALFSYVRFFQYAGAALGPATHAFFSLIGSKWNLPDGAPTVLIMCTLSIVLGIHLFCFPLTALPDKTHLDMLEHYNPDDLPPGKLSKAWASFIAFNTITFLRHSMRLAVEAESLVVFTQVFLFSRYAASYLTSTVMMISIPANFSLGRMIQGKFISLESEEASSRLVQSMLAVQISGSIALFSFAGGGRFGFILFIIGSALFYGVNAAISTLLQVTYLEAKIPGHPILKQDRLMIIHTVIIQLGMAAGPIASRAMNAWWCASQDSLAWFVVSNLVWQYICARRVLRASRLPSLTQNSKSKLADSAIELNHTNEA